MYDVALVIDPKGIFNSNVIFNITELSAHVKLTLLGLASLNCFITWSIEKIIINKSAVDQ